jgi:hypothetical protein
MKYFLFSRCNLCVDNMKLSTMLIKTKAGDIGYCFGHTL